jgi:hypothetical protein
MTWAEIKKSGLHTKEKYLETLANPTWLKNAKHESLLKVEKVTQEITVENIQRISSLGA